VGRFGDEVGILWLPGPGEVRESRAKGATGPKPKVVKVRGTVPESDWKPPTDFPRLTGLVGFDFETYDPDLKKQGSNWPRHGKGKVVGFSLAGEGIRRYYSLYHEGGDNVEDPEQALRYLRDLAASPDVQMVCHNSPYEQGWAKRLGVQFARIPYCTQIAAALLDEYRRYKGGYNLNAVARDYLGAEKDDAMLQTAAAALGLHPKNDLWKIPGRFVGPYGEEDAELARNLFLKMEAQLRAQHLWQVFDLETRYSRVITEQRWRGIRIDVDRAEQIDQEFKDREAEIDREIQTLVGFPVGIWSGDDVAKAFDARGIAHDGSFTQGWMKTLDDPLPRLLLEARKKNKARTTFIESLLALTFNGRVYSQINQLPTDEGGAVSGRASSSNPNQQNQPNKDRDPIMGPLIRGLWLPEEGCQWAAVDYSQQEPRLAVHFAERADARGGREMGDLYRANPRLDMHKMCADLAGIVRWRAKTLNLALMYGKGEAATCHELGFPTIMIEGRNGPREVAGPEGAAFIAAYHAKVPFVNGLKEAVGLAVRRRGFIRTLLGRRCRFGNGKSPAHTGVNRLVQGSAGDQTKKAQVDMYEQLGEIPLVAVHDEVGVNKESDQQLSRVEQCMIEATPLTVPVVVDTAVGRNWGEAL
jgi:DNA polymerase I-like protein with 3'-5' exonuclease and polymerase domains